MQVSRRFEHSRDAFRRVFGELEPEPISVALEATYGWGWFADLLADAGIEAHMAHPLATKAVGANRAAGSRPPLGRPALVTDTNQANTWTGCDTRRPPRRHSWLGG